MLIHNTHAYIITIREPSSTIKQKIPNYITSPPCASICTQFTNDTVSDSSINTHNIVLQMVMVHINNTKHITIANIYMPHRDRLSHKHTPLSPHRRCEITFQGVGSKRHSLQAVELLQRTQAAVQIVSNLPDSSNGGLDLPFFGMRPAVWLALLLTKAGDV